MWPVRKSFHIDLVLRQSEIEDDVSCRSFINNAFNCEQLEYYIRYRQIIYWLVGFSNTDGFLLRKLLWLTIAFLTHWPVGGIFAEISFG